MVYREEKRFYQFRQRYGIIIILSATAAVYVGFIAVGAIEGATLLGVTVTPAIEAFLKIFSKLVKVDQQWRIRFVGNVSDVVNTEIQKLNLEKWVEFIPYVEHKKSVEYMINSDLLLLIIPNTENNKGILTGKLFEYIATGNPIIYIGPEDGDALEILKKTEDISYLNFNSDENIIPFCSSVLKKSEKSKQINYIYSRRNLAETFAKLCLK